MRPPRRPLKALLDDLCRRYDTHPALDRDPLAIPLAYPSGDDRELTAFLAAHLAYGRVDPMLRAIRAALQPLGPTPATWLRATSEGAVRRHLARPLKGWVWRFHTAPDVTEWLLAWKRLDEMGAGGLEAQLLPREGEHPDVALSRLVRSLRASMPASRGTRFSLPDPLEGAACKRWRMFLRWMVREGWPDLGLWRRYPKHLLVIPLDTHVARISRYIGLSDRATPDGRMALEITEALRRLDPADPLRFDFALSHLGILGDCPGVRQRATCAKCPLYAICQAGRPRRPR